MNSPVDAEEKGGSNDLLRWKEGGLSGPFFAVNCRLVRIGSYKFTPVGRVLFSSEGIMLKAPVFQTFNQPSENSGIWINVVIPAQQLLRVDAHFKRQLPVIFLDATPNICRSVCKELGLLKSAGPYWDYLSDEESKKHLTLLPFKLDDSAKNAIKRAFVPKGLFREINRTEANRRLVISSTPKVRDSIAKTCDNSEDLLQKREELFVSMDLSDVIFNVSGRQFTAHKIILATKSPVFKAMFHHSSNKEVLSGQVKVEDIEPDVFQEILLFIYTGRTQLTAMNKMAPGILAAADKYLLQDLKTRFETHLIRQMSAENCLELLCLATHHPAEHLKKYANEYLRRFPGKIHVEK